MPLPLAIDVTLYATFKSLDFGLMLLLLNRLGAAVSGATANSGRVMREKAKPSVVFFNRVYPPERGATGRMLRDLARAFARDGWDVTVVTSGGRARRGRDGGVRVMVCRARFRPGSLARYLYIWLRMLLTGLGLPRHDLVVTMTDPPLMVVAGVVARAGQTQPAYPLVSGCLSRFITDDWHARFGAAAGAVQTAGDAGHAALRPGDCHWPLHGAAVGA